jgi:hypothetical protein
MNLFIDKLLAQILDGNKGSNILTALLVPLVAAHVDWLLAARGVRFQDAGAIGELAKVAGLVILALYGWRVGKRPKAPIINA